MAQATYDDANLILKLYDMRREEKMRTARAWFGANFKYKTKAEFDSACPPNSGMNAYARQVMSYWDMVASFLNAGVLDRHLFYQSGREMLFVWTRLEPLIGEMRTVADDPNYLKNLETASREFIEYWEKDSPSAYAAFLKRVRG